ncbi:MAG TPA: ATP-binding protein [Ktedonobacterales bacterium]|nr:ATP-binding protein [Ktedonobacterales bacterium]
MFKSLAVTWRLRQAPAHGWSVRRVAGQIVLSLLVSAALVTWSFVRPLGLRPQAPPGAPIVLTAITLGMALLVGGYRARLGGRTPAAQALPDPLYTLYLAALMLTGARFALPLAAITPIIVALPGILRLRTSVTIALFQSATATAITFIAGVLYALVGGALSAHLTNARGSVTAAFLASLWVFVAVTLVRTANNAAPGEPFGRALARTFMSPASRFQALLLSIGPLLPLAELLDDVEAEFAWIVFLIPLGVVYYLALVSVRLEQRTDELQTTIGQLRESRQREAELTGYAALVTRAQEDERRRLARELHDDTAQALIALSRGLDALSTRQVEPPLSNRDFRFIHELDDLAKRTLESVRRACQDLRPSVLDDLGLAAALESLAEAVSRQGLPCTFSEQGERVSCAPEVEVTIYRIAQEALANARRHSGARHTWLDVSFSPFEIRLGVRDDGGGFDYDGLLRAGESGARPDGESSLGLGLLGMRERAALIGASLSVESAPSAGTRVTLHVPLRASAPSAGAEHPVGV